ncbi:signal transduction histidine kinase [Conyzicola lurida]|uniref:Signal transduction histidine kinase n=1 Tax=Conyzicola lurida TaxID=1172621 RepID=A0A841AMV0_9MICO|nr:GAF domain-containing protein [Conyzicola lurida]MBB5843658.1 signal transduction histidine kinase [Conyzicola lurida]
MGDPQAAEYGLSLGDLVDEILRRAESPEATRDLLARLISATQAISSDLELPAALHNVVQVACDLVSASYGALGVISPDGMLEEFVHVGMSDGVVAELGTPPSGHGLLGAVITDARPIRLENISHDERSVGFPHGHPPMESFLGVPVRIGGVVYGNLYLTGARRGSFDSVDEQIILTLATMAGQAIANARLYEEARLGQRWLAASEEINQLLLSGELADNEVAPIAGLILTLAEASFVGLVLPSDKPDAAPYAQLFGPLADSTSAYADQEIGELPDRVRAALELKEDRPAAFQAIEIWASSLIGSTMVIPWGDTEATRAGALVISRDGRQHPYTVAERRMTKRFARSVAIARELAAARNDREHVALTDERDRIARDLHDHVIQSLFAVGLGLQSIVGSATGQVAARIASQVDAIDVTIRQIRQTIFQLGSTPSATAWSQKKRLNQLVREILEGEGIDSSLDFRGPVDTLIDSELGEEVSAVLREALSNVVRHAEATRVDILIAVSSTEVRVVVTDNGRGLGELGRRSGLDNLDRRATTRGGTFTTAARAPSGTTIDWAVPVVTQ